MKLPILSVALLSLAALAFAEEVPLEKAQEGARKLNDSLAQTGDFQVAINADYDHPKAIKSGSIGLMIVPDQSLTRDVLSGAKETIVPVGQLWTLGIVLSGSTADKQRTTVLRTKDQDLTVNLYLLGAARNDAGKLELVVFGKDKEPLGRFALAAADGATQSFPIEMTGEKQDEETGRLTLNLLGAHTAEMVFKRSE